MSWTLNSEQALAQAGYRCLRRIFCSRCGHEVWLYALPGNSFRTMLLDRTTFVPHRETCPPPRRPNWRPHDPVTGLFDEVPE